MSAAELPASSRPLAADAAVSPHDTASLWQRACERLAMELPEQQFNTWIRPLPPADVGLADGVTSVCVRVPNRFMLDWIRTQYSARLEGILTELQGGEVRMDIALAPRAAMPAPTQPLRPPGMAMPSRALPPNAQAGQAAQTGQGAYAAPAQPYAQPVAYPQNGVMGGPGVVNLPQHQASEAPHRARSQPQVMGLNPALTFDNLVPGRANQMARTAALHVAGAPGQMYNPLFIYGGVGLGKTHLMNAVGNALLADKPDARILYLHAEQFISDVVKNYQRKTFDELKAKYHQLDLLLIDDVQFFAGKDRTQEEFFNAFEALLAKKAHIIMTSDTYPKGLANIDERLTSRFDSGLTVAIEPPELEMRVAILIKKAALEAIDMPEDVAFFVAKNVRANVRELEGALRKVLAFAKFSHKEITIALAREALKDLLSIQNRQISVENIQKTVADFYKIKVADMYSKKRPASIARPRQIAMYLAKELTQKSLPEIGELFGGRDHTTVLHAVRKIMGERGKDSELNQQLHVLEQTLKG
ncbi:MAG: chromosomal replication initiator protein DnaA [Aquabacterium sp.]|uniref:chromosomal replication initiator protein DnaA n=2 Tax=Aquabacterium sp. TaxID=1872578 RepID=UPI0025BA647D|nr:chromosomal replication initiator protein DnaA [Aquabacterium sp.]MBI3380588.1 chromosomal replication initiator protein DnaA [Aquabacterium sp.]